MSRLEIVRRRAAREFQIVYVACRRQQVEANMYSCKQGNVSENCVTVEGWTLAGKGFVCVDPN